MIDFESKEVQIVGKTRDLRHLYGSDEPGAQFLASRFVTLSPERIIHLSEHDRNRLNQVRANAHLVEIALSAPIIVSRHLELRTDGYYAQNYIARDPNDAETYIRVVLSLSQAADERQGEHRVLTIVKTKRAKLYYKGSLKPRWMEVEGEESR